MRSASNILFCGILLPGLCLTPLSAVDLQFHSEKIQIVVEKQACLVAGEYRFVNVSDIPLTRFPLYYPFPVAPKLPFPDSVRVVNARSGTPIPFSRLERGIVFQVDIPLQGSGTIEVYYRQPTPARRFEYILETTAEWKQALTAAEFSITLPIDLNLTQLSMEPDQVQVQDSVRTYHIIRENFKPDTNLIIQWERSNHVP